jgi:hypothetical protein
MTFSRLTLSLAVVAGLTGPVYAKDLTNVGISVGSLGNPFFVATIKGIEDKAKGINASVRTTAVSSDYDLNKQFTQIDNFIAAGTDVIMLNAVDPVAIGPSVKRAQAAGIVVAAFDVAAAGADVTVMTDNVKAGELACQYRKRAAGLVHRRPCKGLQSSIRKELRHQGPVRQPGRQGLTRRWLRHCAKPPHPLPEGGRYLCGQRSDRHWRKPSRKATQPQ